MLGSERHNAIHVGRLPIKMDWNDCPGSRGHTAARVLQIDVTSWSLNITQHGRRTRIDGSPYASDERVRRNQDFIAWTEPRSNCRQMQRRCTGRNADRVTRAEPSRNFLFESLTSGAETIGAISKYPLEIAPDVIGDRAPLN